MVAVAVHLGELVADLCQNRINDEARHMLESAHTPEHYYGAMGIMKLLRICQVATLAELPQLWIDLAAAPKKKTGPCDHATSIRSSGQYGLEHAGNSNPGHA